MIARAAVPAATNAGAPPAAAELLGLRAADRIRTMAAATLFRRGSISVIDYRCSVGPTDAPFVERHGDFSLSYVRKGSFGCRARGESFELVAGSLLVGRPGDEYMCTHDHVFGDECLSFQLAPALTLGGGSEIWRTGRPSPRESVFDLLLMEVLS